ncbi:MAG TPA: hypothetical protein PKE29_03300 [Phycisphaerales bacterium]|nr:hypothetical protein [Phycisphaerales bacterium]
MKATMTLAAACLACVCLVGCNSGSKTAQRDSGAAVVACSNHACPISGKPVNSKVTSTYGGKTVGFCCTMCKSKFDAMTDADKAAKIAAMK